MIGIREVERLVNEIRTGKSILKEVAKQGVKLQDTEEPVGELVWYSDDDRQSVTLKYVDIENALHHLQASWSMQVSENIKKLEGYGICYED